MTLSAASDMRRSASLKGRIESAALAAGQGIQWVDRNMAALCATPGWQTPWTIAKAAAIGDGDPDRNIGISVNVITDDMIETAVGALIASQGQAAATAEQRIAELEQQVSALTAQVAALTPGTPAA